MDLIWFVALLSFVIVGGLGWFVVSLIRALFSSQRTSGIRQMKLAALLIVVGIIGSGVASIVTAPQTPTTAIVSTVPEKAVASKQTVAKQAEADKSGIKKAASQPGRLSSSQEFVWIRSNQRLLARQLRDPDSAKFGNDYVSYKSGAPVVCGTVNARNAFGGYAGAERYIGMGETVGVFLASQVSDFDALWRKLC